MGTSRRCQSALLLLLVGCSTRKAPEPVWVGHVAPLSGPERALGQSARQGILLAVEDAQAAGTTMAGRPLAVRHADGRGDVETLKGETVRLLAVNKVVGLLGSPDALAAKQLQAARPYSAPAIVLAELAAASPGEGTVGLGARPDARGRALARYAQRQLKGARAALLTDSRGPVATALAEAFVNEWPNSGTALARWDCEREPEQAELVKRVVAWKPDVVLLAANGRDFRRLRAALRQAGWRGPVLHGGEDVGIDAIRRDAPGDPRLYLVTVFAHAGLTAEGKALAARYRERFRQPLDLPAAQAYDGARLLFAVLQEAGNAKGTRVREVLKARETFESLTGPVTWKDGQPLRRLFVVRIAEGKKAVVQTLPAPEG